MSVADLKRKLDGLDSRPRVCLPYGLEFLDLARWKNAIRADGDSIHISSGSRSSQRKFSDVIELYNFVILECENCILSDTSIASASSSSMFFFDVYDRFCFFCGHKEIVKAVYPFERSLMYENYMLSSNDELDSASMREIFDLVHTAS